MVLWFLVRLRHQGPGQQSFQFPRQKATAIILMDFFQHTLNYLHITCSPLPSPDGALLRAAFTNPSQKQHVQCLGAFHPALGTPWANSWANSCARSCAQFLCQSLCPVPLPNPSAHQPRHTCSPWTAEPQHRAGRKAANQPWFAQTWAQPPDPGASSLESSLATPCN